MFVSRGVSVLLVMSLGGCTVTHTTWPRPRDVVGEEYTLTLGDGPNDWRKTARGEWLEGSLAWRDTTTGSLIDPSDIRTLERNDPILGAFIGAPLGMVLGAGLLAGAGALAMKDEVPVAGAIGGAALGALVGLIIGAMAGSASGYTDRYEVSAPPAETPIVPRPVGPQPRRRSLTPAADAL